ncbi:DUF6460 domain-containing protein [Amorphus sp. 3PC139-8]|uniref:DUF6460 domain-containing protein n=1 Tax=Amorphus sp. 3PC139-8 TaxID=2735676 RepID=UPI00345CAACB
MTDRPTRTRRFLGGSLVPVLLKLVVLCFLVGILLASLGFTPEALIYGLRRWLSHLPEMGWDAIVEGGRYVALGAIIVIPIWLVVRIMESTRR